MKMTGNCIYKEHKITKSRETSFCQKQLKNSWKWLWLKNLSYVVQEHLDQKTTYYPKKKKEKVSFICSKSTIETLEQGVQYVRS